MTVRHPHSQIQGQTNISAADKVRAQKQLGLYTNEKLSWTRLSIPNVQTTKYTEIDKK